MPQPGMNGMEPAFGEAYGGHRGLLSPYPLAMSPLGGRTEYDQSVLLMLGSPATPRKRPFELLSDLVDDGGLGEDLPPERWDVSALDEMTRYTKLGLEPAFASEEESTVLMGRWGRSSWEEEEEETRRRRRSEEAAGQPRQQQAAAEGGALGGGQLAAAAAERASASVTAGGGGGGGVGVAGGVGQGGPMMTRRGHRVEVYQVAQEEEEAAAAAEVAAAARVAASAAGLALEHCSTEEHNYSLCQGAAGGGEAGAASSHDAPHHHHHHPQTVLEETEEEEEEEEEEGRAEATARHKDRHEEESPPCGRSDEEPAKKEEEEAEVEVEEERDEDEEEDEDEDEGEDGAEETTVEAEDSSSSETEGEVEAEPAKRPGERPQKRRCFWEYRRARENAAKKKLGGEVRWSLSWSSSTLPSTLYRREGKKGRRKARKTDASDLTPNPQKLHNIGEQLQKLNAAIDGMGPVNDLPAVARARSRKEKNKLASRACRLKKKAQHEANKIKLWGLNQEYENLLGALLRIKEVIRRRVESSEEEDTDERGMTQRLEDILKGSSGPLVAGRTKDFVQRILAASAGGQSKGKETAQGEDEEAG